MDYEELEAHRKVLLDLYRSLSETLSKEGDEIPGFIKRSQKNIEAKKFLLAIVGEVKAGKSTFINALLREEILPVGTQQASSEIVEIYHSDKTEVQVTFANCKPKVVKDDPKLFLKKIASVNEEYRDIPFVQINSFLMKKYRKEKGKAVFEKGELEDFISDPELENIHKLDDTEFRGKICDYIEKNIACDAIPKEVTLGYPHKFSEFKHFRIVDTPGINAIGGIENQTKKFINKADAVIYLHKGPLESKALRNALENELPEKVKEHLILVLTHKKEKFHLGEDEIKKQAEMLYPEIGSDNTFFVDSLTELHLEEFYKRKTMDEIQNTLDKNPEIMELTATCFLKAQGDKYAFINLLEAQSNFEEIRKRIERDAQNSASIQMKNFANAIKEEYEVLDDRISVRIAPLKMKYQAPQSFASEIGKQKCEMERMRNDYNNFTSDLIVEFSPRDMNSRYYQEIEQIVNKYRNEINQKKFNPDHHTQKTVEAYVETLRDNYGDEMTKFVDSLKADFKRRIADRNVEAQSDYSITVPIISLGSIWDTALDAANKKIKKQVDKVDSDQGLLSTLFHFFTLFIFDESDEKKEKIRKTLPQQLWKEMQSPFVKQLDTHLTRMQENIDQLINDFCKHYQSKFNGELMERKQYMEDLEKEEKTNEDLKNEISTLETQKKTIEDNIKMCVKIKGEL